MTLTQRMVTFDSAQPRPLAEWWARALDGQIVHDLDGWFVIVAAGPVSLGFQKVADPTPGKNRLHIDFTTQDRSAQVRRLVEMGAVEVAEHTLPGGTFAWTVLRDPDGNEFCVASSR